MSGFSTPATRTCRRGPGLEPRALALKLAIEFALGLAQLAGEALEGFLLVYPGFRAGLGLEAGNADGDFFGSAGCGWGSGLGAGLGQSLNQQGDFAANAIAGGEFAAGIGYRRAQELLVDLGQLAGDNDAQIRAPDGLQIGQRAENAVRGFVKNESARSLGACGFGCQRFQAAPAFSGRKPMN